MLIIAIFTKIVNKKLAYFKIAIYLYKDFNITQFIAEQIKTKNNFLNK